ncbi:NAD(P)-dependent dehydrogenase (short-subunit alcohol dehydrogenase family) [Ereboglobus sp. PH5-5]|uniref:SDR family oxidoreductase n=1 Tax=Ereboglobus sp. PH5-5 TaxID=2940529 RepID=UPI0024066316|nr:SDR family oxidoreductase [Ereboglobus sp. PH5-5]MDF9833062.1 NAD(P)-dependent dehydrogenase (short-subunit alcohol dehydrogenase family) [Ereboglobus sp. PH5-5]
MNNAKKIVVTGVTRGLGRALAEEFIRLGHTLIGCGRGADGILDLRFTHSSPHDFSAVDVSVPAKVDLWAERVTGIHGAPDLLINNAGFMNKPAPLWKVPPEDFARVLDVNVKGMANVIRAFAPDMIKAGRGVIVNFSSGWGRSVSPEVAPYCAAKWAVEGLTRALAEELPAGMAAVSLNPGVIDTDMLRQSLGADAASYQKPEEWAKRAAPVILGFGPNDNGRPADV